MVIKQTSVDFFAIARILDHNRDQPMIDLDPATVTCRSYLSNIENNTQRFADFHHCLIR
jgi:hypothetical protein